MYVVAKSCQFLELKVLCQCLCGTCVNPGQVVEENGAKRSQTGLVQNNDN